MKLAIVSPYPPAVTGIGQYGYHVSLSLAQSGQFSEITVLAGRSKKDGVSYEIDVKAEGTRTGRVDAYATASTMRIEYLWNADHMDSGAVIQARLRQIQPDLVWYNLGASIFGRSPLANLASLLSLGMAPARGFPSVVTLHELVELADLKALQAPGGQLAHLAARLLTDITTRADVVCLTLQRYVTWLAQRRPSLACVHIPISSYYQAEKLTEPCWPELLFFSSLAPYKGLEVLLSAFRLLAPDYHGLRLTVAGVTHPRFPGYAEKLREQASTIPGIHWLGQVPEEDVRSLFAQSQVVVLPYHASTGSSSVIYQAAAWGRALVASNLTDIRTAADENDLLLNYFTPGDAASLAETLRGLLDHPERRAFQTAQNLAAIQRVPPQETCLRYLQAFNLALDLRHSPKHLELPAEITTEPV